MEDPSRTKQEPTEKIAVLLKQIQEREKADAEPKWMNTDE